MRLPRGGSGATRAGQRAGSVVVMSTAERCRNSSVRTLTGSLPQSTNRYGGLAMKCINVTGPLLAALFVLGACGGVVDPVSPPPPDPDSLIPNVVIAPAQPVWGVRWKVELVSLADGRSVQGYSRRSGDGRVDFFPEAGVVTAPFTLEVHAVDALRNILIANGPCEGRWESTPGRIGITIDQARGRCSFRDRWDDRTLALRGHMSP